MILQGKGGIKYDLQEPQFAEGGEGKIYYVKGHPDLVAKLYKPGMGGPEKERKLIQMYMSPPEKSVLDQIVWPVDVLYDGKSFVGFLMRKFDFNEDLNVIYEYGSAAKYPDMSWGNKIRIAKNLCAVLNAVHEAGHVVGDFNPNNISVNPNTGYIIFVDTDSYHITDSKNTYRCKVGMAEYVPSEVQPKMRIGLDKAPLPTYTKDTDNFALAVHIFQLLMNGVHPFACAILPSMASVMMPNTSDSITKGETPFFKTVPGKQIPKFAPPVSILPKEIQKLFEKAFVDGHKDPSDRPDAKTWFFALEKLEKQLKKCKTEKHHEYYDSLSKCPWCSADASFTSAVSKAGRISQSTYKASFPTKKKNAPSGNFSQYSAPRGRQKTGTTKFSLSGISNFIKKLLGHTKRAVILLAILSLLGALFTFVIFPKYIYPELPDNNFNTPEIVQAYSGSYSSNSGQGDAIINILSCDKEGKIEGTFEFFDKSNYGKYEVNGKITEKKRSGDLKLQLNFEKWIHESEGYSPLGEMNVSVTDKYQNFSCSAYSIKWSAGENEEYYIKSADDFKKLNNSSSAYLLKNDIDLTGIEWTPIEEFSGTLFGNGYSVNNFSLDTSKSNVGFFSVLKGTVINLNFNNASVNVSDINENVGVVCGKLTGSIVGVTVSGSVSAEKSNNVGGITGCVASSSERFFDLENSADVKGAGHVGGIIGHIASERISMVFDGLKNTGAIEGSGECIGGIAGYCKIYDSVYKPVLNVADCENTGSVKGLYRVGGIMGYSCSSHDGIIKNCISSASIEASAFVGCIAGEAENIHVDNCKNDGSSLKITGYFQQENVKCSYAGGFVGRGERISNCVNNVSLDCTSGGCYVGGVMGYVQFNCSAATMSGLENTADIKGEQYVGGIFGFISEDKDSVILDGLKNTGSVEGAKDYIGGIAGYCRVYDGVYKPTLTVSDCDNTGNISGQYHIGGILGYSVSSHDGLISDCTCACEIKGDAYLGCIAGTAENILVDKCVNDSSSVKVEGYKQDGSNKYAYVGGYVGKGSKISNCKNTVSIDCSSSGYYAGGIMGFCDISCGSATFSGLENTASVTGLSYVGGVFGYINEEKYSIILDGLKNSAAVSGKEDYIGGIAGYCRVYDNVYFPILTVSDCNNTGDISGRDYIGGIAGYSSSSHDGLIENCSVSASVNARAYAGCIAGEASGILVDTCNNSGSSISLHGYTQKDGNKYSYAGGYVGYGDKIVNCVNDVSIDGTGGGYYIGGIMGFSNIGCNDSLISGLENKADITGEGYTGGIFGGMKSNKMNIIFDGLKNSGNIISHNEFAGGIIAYFNNRDGVYHPHFNVENCINEGAVFGGKYVGGISGYVSTSGGKISNCQNLGTVFGLEETDNVFGKSEGIEIP